MGRNQRGVTHCHPCRDVLVSGDRNRNDHVAAAADERNTTSERGDDDDHHPAAREREVCTVRADGPDRPVQLSMHPKISPSFKKYMGDGNQQKFDAPSRSILYSQLANWAVNKCLEAYIEANLDIVKGDMET